MHIFKYYYRIIVRSSLAQPGGGERIIGGVYSVDTPIADTQHVQFMLQQLGQQLDVNPGTMDLTNLTYLGEFQMEPSNEGIMDA